MLIGFSSIHFLYLACIISILWFVAIGIQAWRKKESARLALIIRWVLISGLSFLIVNSFWIIPALTRTAPLESRFDPTYYTAFAAAPNGNVPVTVNAATLGGFWGERLAWKYYFVWPQDQLVFWVAAILIFVLAAWGICQLWKDPKTRWYGALLILIAVGAYITSLGAADTVFKEFNLFLYAHIPQWNGLRDSQKISGILALVYAVFAGIGVSAFLAKLKKHWIGLESMASIAILLLSATFGMYMWAGLHGQLDPVWYPASWDEAKTEIDKLPAGEKVLVLPWHGYLSLDFAGNRIVANPAESFFGHDHVIQSRSVQFAGIYDQESDAAYRSLDEFVQASQQLSQQALVKGLEDRKISEILIIANKNIPDSAQGLTTWSQFSNPADENSTSTPVKNWGQLLPQSTRKILTTDEIELWNIDK